MNSYLDKRQQDLYEMVNLIDKKVSKGKGIKSLKKTLLKRIKHLDEVIEQLWVTIQQNKITSNVRNG